MTTWIAFLRAINLGPRRKYPMAELRATLTAAGFEDVATHINTGNVRLGTRRRSRERIVEALEQAMAADRGFEVPTVLLSPAELVDLAAEGAGLRRDGDGRHHYVVLLAGDVSAAAARELEDRSIAEERVVVSASGRAVHLIPTGAFLDLRTDPARVERITGLAGTARNLTVIRALAERWGTSA